MIIKGDINGDGRIGIEDLILVQMHLLNLINLSGNEFIAADTNDTGGISISDLGNIQMHILGLILINEVIE